MDTFIDVYNLLKLDQEDIIYLHISVTSNKIEPMIKSFPRRKSPRRNGFTAEFYQPLSQHQ
jgi:hypothetical protein